MQAPRYHERIKDSPFPRIITAVTKDRIPYFSIPILAKLAYESLSSAAKINGIHLHAFVVLPDHVHIVAKKFGEKTVSDFMRSYKGVLSREIGKWHNENHAKAGLQPRLMAHFPVWQVSFNQLLIYGKDSFRNRIRYVANNAVKHGIVTDRDDYPWTYVAPEYMHMVSS